MEILTESLAPGEFAPETTFLNTASTGLLPARAVDALQRAVRFMAGGTASDELYVDMEQARESFARLAGVGRDPRCRGPHRGG